MNSLEALNAMKIYCTMSLSPVSQENQTTLHKSVKGPLKVIFYNIEPDAETAISVTSHDDNHTLTSVNQPEMSPNIGMLFCSQV